ncbi:hypothetical protein SAMN02787142_2105 [Burkholderia sp. WP9]|jgi:hypothetical protein|uniref:hypothetical protein n=1 Tax=Burkholderia sp. WP9 TaxID=1500263 RepID=UPI00089758D3|nr:hypothetical protein [Burkholderia sp. WP9]SEC87328.1 hypothetical protein SAMN02787142_2105 [Burkholderia sp. WP9]
MTRALKARRQRPARPLRIAYAPLREQAAARRREYVWQHGRIGGACRAAGQLGWSVAEPAASIVAPVVPALVWFARATVALFAVFGRLLVGVPRVR